MRNRRATMLCLVVFVVGALTALAGDSVTGKWELTVDLSDGQGGTAAFDLEQADDGTLSGTYNGALGQQKIKGTVKGEKVEFSFDSDAGKVSYVGSVKDGKMSGECTYGALGSGTFEGEKVD